MFLAGCRLPQQRVEPRLVDPAGPPILMQSHGCNADQPYWPIYYTCTFAQPVSTGDTVFAICWFSSPPVGIPPKVSTTDNQQNLYTSIATDPLIGIPGFLPNQVSYGFQSSYIASGDLTVQLNFSVQNVNWACSPAVYEVFIP
jgi:hypothetical protein